MLVLFTALFVARDTHSQNTFQALKSLDPQYWTVDNTTRIGYTTRIKATQQNPYPFCFSTGAAMLYDQHRCQHEKKNCSKVNATSFLSVTPAGQKLPQNRLDVDAGGNAVLSLKYLLEVGYTEHKRCNYNHLDSNDPEFNKKAIQMLHSYNMAKNYETAWNNHKDYAPYLERFYRMQWNNTLRIINPDLTDEATQDLLGRTENKQHLMAKVLMSDDCTKNLKRETRYKIRFKTNHDIEKDHELIESLLRQNKPVLINFCVQGKTGDVCIGNNKHAAIIVASAKATHRGTGDQRTAYWIVNSWGEPWQEKNNDGWIFADSFLESVFAELVWLDQK